MLADEHELIPDPIELPDEALAQPPAGTGAYAVTKRAIDVIVSALFLVVLSPLLAVFCALIVVDSPGGPVFRQWRVGKNGRMFRVYKLRTMVRDAERVGPALTQPGDVRVTRCGRWLRRWSLDELPQLINVITGDMSLVGPRPELPSIVRTYTPQQLEVLKVPPGITGWSQIQGRDDLPIPEKLELDRSYVYSRSLSTDLAILARTLRVVIRGDGIKR